MRAEVMTLWGVVLAVVAGVVPGMGCSRGSEPKYYYFEQLPGEGWSMHHELFFSTSDPDSTQLYDVNLVLRLDKGIRYREIPVGITFETPERHLSTEVVRVPIDHHLLRQGGYTLYEQSLRLKEGVRFPRQGVYTYSVRHLSTDSIMTGVVEVGLIIQPHK